MSPSSASLWRLVLGSAAVAAFFLADAANPIQAQAVPGQPHHQAPADGIAVTVQPGARDAYFAALRRFAEKYGFAIRTAQTTPSGEDFLVQLFREDIKATGTNALNRRTFRLYFFSSCAEEADETMRKDIADMVADLRVTLSKEKGFSVEPGNIVR